MPAVSEAQRKYLNYKFGHAWVKAHHFDNKGKLPAHVGSAQKRLVQKRAKAKHGRKHPRKIY